MGYTINSDTVGRVPHIRDTTRRWVETYRIQNKVKPAFILRAATDSNYINNSMIKLPAYGGAVRNAQAISNILTPGQRVPGVLSWQATESLESVTQTASVSVLDVLPLSKITTTITGFKIGTGGQTDILYRGLNTNGQTLSSGSTQFDTISSLPARWHGTKIRYQWVRDGLGIAQQLLGDNRIDQYTDQSLHQNEFGKHTFREDNLLYRMFEPEVIEVSDLSKFPSPAVPAAESEGSNEWWNVDLGGVLSGVGAYYILVGKEVMRVVRTDPNNNRIFVIPGGRGVAGQIGTHNIGDTVTLLGFPPYSPQWTGLGYLTPSDYKLSQSPFRPGTCWVSYEGYGNPGDYTNPKGKGPFSRRSIDNNYAKTFDRANNMVFTGYWFTLSPSATMDDNGSPQLQVSFQSSGYILSEQKINLNNTQRSKNLFDGWAKTTFDKIGYKRSMPGDWFDFNMWDPTLPGAYPLTISTEYAQNKAFMDHMTQTNMGTTCEWCQKEWIDFVMNHEHSTPTGSIHEARAVGKHIYFESIRVFNLGGQFNAGPIKSYGRLMHALAQAAWDNPQPGDNLGTRWTKLPNQLHQNLNTWTNGRVWNGQLFYDTENKSVKTYDWSNMPDNDRAVYGKRKALHCPFTSQYDNQPWSQPMQDLASLNRMTYTITREGFPVFVPIGHKLRGMPHSELNNTPGFHYSGSPSKYFVNSDDVEVADNDIGLGEWHLAYGGSISSYSTTVDPSSVLTIVYVSCQTAFGTEISFTLPAAGTGVKFRSHGGGAGLSKRHGEKAPARVIMYSNVVGNKEGLELTSGAQQTDTASLDNLLLGLDWDTNPASWGLKLKRGPDGLNQVDAQPPVPKVKPNMNIAFDTKDSKDNPDLIRDLQKFLNFMLERRYIGGAVFINSTGVTETALQIAEDGKFTGKWGKATRSAIQLLQTFLNQQSNQNNLGGAQFKKVSGNWKYIQENGNARNDTDNDAQWGVATYLASKKWLDSNSEYIKTDIWWYVQNGLPWDQYIAAITGFAIPQNQVPQTDGLWQLDQLGIATQAENWMKRFFIDAITYGNSVVDDSINKAYQKTISSNFGDPRIQVGDVIWISVPGYSSHTDMFGHTKVPFRNGMYVTSISRSIDLQNATSQATYQGYRYRGQLDHNVIKNFSNYVSKVNKV